MLVHKSTMYSIPYTADLIANEFSIFFSLYCFSEQDSVILKV
jgi:hypothetical protein